MRSNFTKLINIQEIRTQIKVFGMKSFYFFVLDMCSKPTFFIKCCSERQTLLGVASYLLYSAPFLPKKLPSTIGTGLALSWIDSIGVHPIDHGKYGL